MLAMLLCVFVIELYSKYYHSYCIMTWIVPALRNYCTHKTMYIILSLSFHHEFELCPLNHTEIIDLKYSGSVDILAQDKKFTFGLNAVTFQYLSVGIRISQKETEMSWLQSLSSQYVGGACWHVAGEMCAPQVLCRTFTFNWGSISLTFDKTNCTVLTSTFNIQTMINGRPSTNSKVMSGVYAVTCDDVNSKRVKTDLLM